MCLITLHYSQGEGMPVCIEFGWPQLVVCACWSSLITSSARSDLSLCRHMAAQARLRNVQNLAFSYRPDTPAEH